MVGGFKVFFYFRTRTRSSESSASRIAEYAAEAAVGERELERRGGIGERNGEIGIGKSGVLLLYAVCLLFERISDNVKCFQEEFAKRPPSGTAGRPIKLETNHFAITYAEQRLQVIQYHVDIIHPRFKMNR